jgi:hypothetical protein
VEESESSVACSELEDVTEDSEVVGRAGGCDERGTTPQATDNHMHSKRNNKVCSRAIIYYEFQLKLSAK